MTLEKKLGNDDLSSYQITSRREILALLRGMRDSNQFVSIEVDGGQQGVVTSVLDVDPEEDVVVLDRAQDDAVHRRILECDDILFETLVDKIRILFFSGSAEECLHNDRPALRIPTPTSVIRLQRRQHYRIPTPLINPARCTMQIPMVGENRNTTVVVPLKNVSGGGIAILDEKGVLNPAIGTEYRDCRIDFPGGTLIVATLEIRNCMHVRLPNGKFANRLGCLFVDIPRPMLAAVQRYITRLEREQNAKTTGLG
ncbi:c-di-GMP-binding flagellar brake protein YcgR, contains PilZNR and PilZ domains [Noviherbaspirillum humi]|uniref:Flagellar brake protein YcgR n=1 Tax=Noviherbaspirillum humi TaxID=1688639 RepID=A0A239FXJ2_9BURK|nr:flagellar brake protein [Noviherbaspirillum humi]SNS61621.1 c-di-GMP-binding flagellar brake protein YcgR, contains PilZNR and PilZ domains [Noviherbaspirillum humi]